MAQHDYSIANQGFPATRTDINNALSAISTTNSGTSAPSSQFAGQFWLDTNTPSGTTWTLYFHDGSDDITFATIDTSANTVNFSDSAPITALNNPSANELVTVGSTTTELDAETNLTFDGTTLAVTGTVEPSGDTSSGDNAAIGYTAAEGLILTGQGSTSDVTIKNDADGIVLEVPTGTTNVEITSGNLVIGTSGKGIDFSATADSSGTMTSELLDDYEEGTFSGALTDSSGGMTVTMDSSNDALKYTKIGDICHIGGVLVVSGVSGSLTGYINLTLPFTVKDTADASSKWTNPIAVYNVDFPTANQYGAYMNAGEAAALAFFHTWGENSSGGKMNLTASSQLYFSFSFPTA